MSKIRNIIGRLVGDKESLEAVEYRMTVALVVTATMTLLGMLILVITGQFNNLASILNAVN